MLTPLSRSVISRTRPLNRSRAFGAIARLIPRPAVKLKPRNFWPCGSATVLFAAITFLHDEQRYVLHHPLTRPLAANVDITIVRVPNKAMSAALQLPVEFVERELTQQWL